MQSILREWYAQYRYGKLAQPLDNTIEQYSVRRLAGQVAEYLDEL
jgi:hypothetical protein